MRCVTAFGADRVRTGSPLAPLTTFRVGGPADWLIETRNSDEIVTRACGWRARPTSP